jgi:hypothetical protein
MNNNFDLLIDYAKCLLNNYGINWFYNYPQVGLEIEE